MTDLEIVKKCAERMGVNLFISGATGQLVYLDAGETYEYDPLHDGAQAMALIQKYADQIRRDEKGDWNIRINKTKDAPGAVAYRFPDLKRAICECVARLP